MNLFLKLFFHCHLGFHNILFFARYNICFIILKESRRRIVFIFAALFFIYFIPLTLYYGRNFFSFLSKEYDIYILKNIRSTILVFFFCGFDLFVFAYISHSRFSFQISDMDVLWDYFIVGIFYCDKNHFISKTTKTETTA